MERQLVSIIIPTFNGGSRIGQCLHALLEQASSKDFEILVVNDGSTDDTARALSICPDIKVITQSNAGPAAARNRGAQDARGAIILFTDDDCVPAADWLERMLEPFADKDVVGVKGAYRTHQKELAARFVQIEYEDRYRLMSRFDCIDFVDTYSAAFRRERFLEMNGYDTSFPVACAEDIELSYRMSARGWKMKFAQGAIVCHTHPDTLSRYLRKKFKFAFWRMLAVRKNPTKAAKDSHTPQLMKLQVLFLPALLCSLAYDVAARPSIPASLLVVAAFLVSTVPFTIRAIAKDPVVGILAPGFLAARACAQMFGVGTGLIYAYRKPARVFTKSPV